MMIVFAVSKSLVEIAAAIAVVVIVMVAVVRGRKACRV
jgi:hypothetical protein